MAKKYQQGCKIIKVPADSYGELNKVEFVLTLGQLSALEYALDKYSKESIIASDVLTFLKNAQTRI